MQVAFAAYPLLLSTLGIYWVLTARMSDRSAWVLRALAGANVVVFAFAAGPWAFTSIHLRCVVLGLFAVALVYSYRRARRTEEKPAVRATSWVLLASFLVLNSLALAGRVAPAGSVDVQFPLRSGSYYVLQGGDSFVTNPFHVASGTPLALDLARLTPLGNRAAGIAPAKLDAYAIFGDTVHSPCAGIVVAARDGLDDNPPAHPGVGHRSGNHVIVQCAGVDILLAHLMKGSVAGTPGSPVAAGQPLGKVGNSGHSMEPHLHIDAKTGAVARPLLFDGRFLSANDRIGP